MTNDAATLAAALIRDVPDFPTPGILFKDIGPLIGDATALRAVIDHFAARHTDRIDAVAGIEARGFIFGGALATALGVGFIPIRKRGKLPGGTVERSYDLEYGSAALAVQVEAVVPGQRVLILDDVLATGGTAAAACALIEQVHGHVVGVDVVLELVGLGGRDRLTGRDVHALTSA
jgi:adenine phosphoribosyltransferase